MSTSRDAHDPSVADRVLSHEVRKYWRAISPRYAQGGSRDRQPALATAAFISARASGLSQSASPSRRPSSRPSAHRSGSRSAGPRRRARPGPSCPCRVSCRGWRDSRRCRAACTSRLRRGYSDTGALAVPWGSSLKTSHSIRDGRRRWQRSRPRPGGYQIRTGSDSCLRRACVALFGCHSAQDQCAEISEGPAFFHRGAIQRGQPRLGHQRRCSARCCANRHLRDAKGRVQSRRRRAPLKAARSSARTRFTSSGPARPLALPSSHRRRSTSASRSCR